MLLKSTENLMEQKTIEEQMHRLEQILSFTFKNINHLSQAMCAIKKDKNNLANESLALVGDTLLKFVLADYIYSQKPNSTKKDITEIKIVAEQNTTLNKIEKKNQILDYAYNEKHFHNDPNIPDHERVSDKEHSPYLEAIIGAIYYDSGYTKAKKWIKTWLIPKIKDHSQDFSDFMD